MNTIEEKLKFLSHITKIEKCQDPGMFKERYFLYFEQPIDHSNPSGETFVQRVEFGFNDIDNPTVFYCGGYALFESINVKPDPSKSNLELILRYNANYINVDYRYFGKSFPEGLNYDSVEYWKHLTLDNAVKDFHNLYQIFKTIFKNKFIHAGISKGGLTTNYMACKYPNDADVYISYVHVSQYERQDKNFFVEIYTTLGSDVKDKNGINIDLDRCHKALAQIQLYMLEHKKEIQFAMEQHSKEKGWLFSKWAYDNPGLLYNSTMHHFAMFFWQYANPFEELHKIETLLNIKDKSEQLKEVIEWSKKWDMYWNWSRNGYLSHGFFFESYTELGYLDYYSKPMVDNILKYLNVSEDYIYKLLGYPKEIRDDIEKNLAFNLVLSQEQIAYFKQNLQIGKDLDDFYENTKCNVLFILGTADVWYNTRLNKNNNLKKSPFIIESQEYGVGIGMNHTARINTLPEKQSKKCWELIDKWIGLKKDS